MDVFFEPLRELAQFETLTETVKAGDAVHVVGAAELQKAHIMAAMLRECGKRGLVLSWSEGAARQLADDLSSFLENVVYLPQGDFMPYHTESVSYDLMRTRARALGRIAAGDTVVMSVASLLGFVLPPDRYVCKRLRVGDTCADLDRTLAELGYKRVPMLEGAGQFSVRGGIFDVFPPTEEQPVRIEFFDDEVDSMRVFNLETQLSEKKIDTVCITPAVIDDAEGDILDYFGTETVTVIDEPLRVSEGAENYETVIAEKVAELMLKGVLTQAKERYINSYKAAIKTMKRGVIVGFSGMSHACPDYTPKQLISITGTALPAYSGQMHLLTDDVQQWCRKHYRILILAGSTAKASGIAEALAEADIPYVKADADTHVPRGVAAVYDAPLRKGFVYPHCATVFVSGSDIFARQSKKHHVRTEGAKVLRSFDELKPGDYVVHRTHGIGQFTAMERIETDGTEKDYLKIAYRNSDTLYVPVTQLNLLYKYSHAGSDAPAPKVNRLGGSEWQNTKAGVKKSVRQLAIKLVELYAERAHTEGHAFLKDTPWQAEFESEFPYEETPDQLASVAEIKRDMENPRPMDRLLCGDVGYGKTEVAIRAAFKCIMEGMQCAYLVPTTILASQHYNHFLERMKNFPVRVEMLSRFRTPVQQKKTIERLKNGGTDLVVGTHRLLADSVSFKRLGLLVIDEEQRFGVEHKEKIKNMKRGIDVLTLTATPIPRTLNMAMTGIRDMSVLANPPEDRHPIQTYVFEHDETVVTDAIETELSRGGQVYYVFNRIQGIFRVANRLRELVPHARIAVAHGRMQEGELETVMLDMLNGEIDVLVCTTIIESGIDIPNVNTLIVENADRMGLAQLYQLRGRVGRSNRLAYAFLTFKRDKALSEVAEKRLLAIKEFTELGSGFKIAMRDLEIRGAGNLLGPEQHGFMASVGYDMYVKLLEEAVTEMRGGEDKTETAVDLAVDASIPESYIENAQLRLEAYRLIADIASEEEALQVTDELIDRYGDLPKRVSRLIDVALIRVYASAAGIDEITQAGERILLYFDRAPEMEMLSKVMANYRGKTLFSAGERPHLALRAGFLPSPNNTENLKILLKDLKI